MSGAYDRGYVQGLIWSEELMPGDLWLKCFCLRRLMSGGLCLTFQNLGHRGFYRAMRCISAVFAVCPSVTFVDHVKTNKHIFKIFSPSGSDTILVFPYQTGCRYSDGNSPNGGVECRSGREKRDSGRISGFAAYRSTVLSTVRVAKCEKQSRDERRQASSTHRAVCRPLSAQEDDEVFVTGSTLYAGDEGRSNTP